MNPNWFGIVCAAAAVFAFFISHFLARKLPPKSRYFWTFVSLLLAIPGASFAAYYAHLVEVPTWYYEFRSWRGTEVLLVFIGIAGGCVVAVVGSLARIMTLVVVTIFVTVPFVKPFLGPFPEGALRDQWDGEVCLQSTYSTCGAAATASLLRYHGITVGEGVLAKEAHSYMGGTEVWYLARAVRKRGLRAVMRVTEGFDPEMRLPTISGVRFGHTGHFIAILSREGGRFHVADPLRGSEVLGQEELRTRYQFTGFWMEVTK